jgi:hypothetical protein
MGRRLLGRGRRLREGGDLGKGGAWSPRLAFWHTFGMARFGGPGLWCRSMGRGGRFLLFGVGLVAGWGGAVLAAQDAGTQQDQSIHTLHVYANLVQIPTLVLGPNRERLEKSIAESRFSVSIDDGPWFRATHVRREGDDPISLSILLDVSGGSSELMPKIADAISGLAPLSLHARDRVSIYVLDCSFRQTLEDAPAEQDDLKRAVDSALQMWSYRRQKKHESDCKPSSRLWDALTSIILDPVYHLPGRRVVLAITDGSDKGSTSTWNYVRVLAQSAGVAIFGVVDVPPHVTETWTRGHEDPFNSVCQLSGGTIFMTNETDLAETLKRFTQTVRERYIVEFPRPLNSTPGEHGLRVKIAKSEDDFVRSAGISVPMPDPAVLADPTTVPSDPTLSPELGTRKVMTKPQ